MWNKLRPSKKNKLVLRPLFFKSDEAGRVFFFFYFQSNIRHMCSTLLKTNPSSPAGCPTGRKEGSLLLFGMLVSSAYGSGNDVLWEEVMSTSKALHYLCIEGDWSFTLKVLLLLSLCSTKLNLRYRPNNATASETLTDNMIIVKGVRFWPSDWHFDREVFVLGR